MRRVGKIGVYGSKTRALQRRLTFEAFGLTFKSAFVYRYLGSRVNASPDIDDIQTKVFFEVPDRAYSDVPIEIPIGMEPLPETKTDFSRFGLINPLQDETRFRIHVDDFQPLEREMIVGDVFEIPFFEKYGESYWEVTDVDFRSEAEKFIVVVHATPLSKSRATREIPVDRSNQFVMDDLMPQCDISAEDQVPNKELFLDDPVIADVDYRNTLQASFLDDITKQI
jgi:hypothetical protein